MIEDKKYTNNFFSEIENKAYESAKVVLPLVQQFIEAKSIIDVGCGTGMWLKVWNEDVGVQEYLGIEGPYLEKKMIKIPMEKIIFHDLKVPIKVDKKFDLAMSLEVAEHLPESTARQFVQTLTTASNIVLFSAALPHQEGTYHINEQYPEYWASHFKEFNFIPVDCIRPNIWNNPVVESYYKQNILIFVKDSVLQNFPALISYASSSNPQYLTRIHPIYWELKNKHIRRTKTLFGFLNWKWYMFKRKYLKKNGS